MEASGKNTFAVGGVLICFLGVSVGFVIAQQAPPAPGTVVVGNSPSARSGFNYFRQLLAASPTEREKLLAGKSAAHRQVLTNSLQSFDSANPEEREHRLRLLQVRFDLAELMRLAPHQRAGRLQFVPASERPLIEERLRLWDQCSPDDQKVLLEQERLVRVTSVLAPMPGRGVIALSSAASNQLYQIESTLDRFKNLPESKRAEIQSNFDRLFDLPDPASAKQQLDSLPFSAVEREQMEKTLAQFRSLSKPQRDTCIRNFRKLSQLPPEELRRFLRNAEEWQKMTPKDREEWRRVINTLPPFPSGMGLSPGPPIPPAPASKPLSTAVNRTN
jgi:Protein of unknown function (DUF3106)